MTPDEFMDRLLKAAESRSGDELLDMEEAAKLLRISRKALNQCGGALRTHSFSMLARCFELQGLARRGSLARMAMEDELWAIAQSAKEPRTG